MPFPDNKEDLTVFIDDLTEQMERRFSLMRTSVLSKLDEMGRRVEDLERDLNSLAGQAGIATSATSSPSPSSSLRSSKASLSPTRAASQLTLPSPPSSQAVEI